MNTLFVLLGRCCAGGTQAISQNPGEDPATARPKLMARDRLKLRTSPWCKRPKASIADPTHDECRRTRLSNQVAVAVTRLDRRTPPAQNPKAVARGRCSDRIGNSHTEGPAIIARNTFDGFRDYNSRGGPLEPGRSNVMDHAPKRTFGTLRLSFEQIRLTWTSTPPPRHVPTS